MHYWVKCLKAIFFTWPGHNSPEFGDSELKETCVKFDVTYELELKLTSNTASTAYRDYNSYIVVMIHKWLHAILQNFIYSISYLAYCEYNGVRKEL